jgi:hypothetical protein
MKDESLFENRNGAFSSLYKLGGAAAWIVAALTLGEIIFFVFFPPPETNRDWFVLIGLQLYKLGLVDC